MEDDQIEEVGHTVVACFSLAAIGVFLVLAAAAYLWGWEL